MSPPEEPDSVLPWHARPADDVLHHLDARSLGLTDEEAVRRLAACGPNRLRPPQARSPYLRLLTQFHNVLIYVLLGAGAVTAALRHWIDSAVIFGVVIINALIGFVQEGKAESALDAIRNMLSPSATLLRNGRRIVAPAENIVPGDIILLQPGDKVPADLRLIQAKGLQIEEAALTGESLPVDKETAPVGEQAALADRTSMAYAGTLVTRGQANGVAVATGDRTEIGHINALLGKVQPLTTPLIRQMATFSRSLTIVTLLVAAATFVFGIAVRDYAATDMLLAVVGLAVAAIPEGLPAIMTITLAIGVQRMARRNAIIRRLPAVETLGAVSVICSDKTGTLTRNEMTVRSITTSHHVFEVTGVGYAPTGAFLLDGVDVSIEQRSLLCAVTEGAMLCSDAVVREADGTWIVEGDPTEGALVTAAMKAGVDPGSETEAWPRTDVIPFESEHRFMATLHHDRAGNAVLHVKGAPERILQMCHWQRADHGDEALDLPYWQARMEEIGARGQRILALAARHMASEHRELRFDDVDHGLTLIGLFGLLDPPRQEAIEAVARCQAAGIRVKMITGDHGQTARAVAGQLGLVNTAEFMIGKQLDTLDDAALRARVAEVDVFARTSPEHKLRLVQSLQAGGQVVAMTGDGVNDAPALKRADIGVAMGRKGTEAAKESAGMVLADDNFATIAHAVEEGRTVYDNLKKAVIFILPSSGGEALTLIAAIAFGQTLPITPVQILWINMITTVTLALALAFEPAESDVMRRTPRRPDEPILSGFLVWRVVFVSMLLLLGTFGLFLWERAQGADVALARTVAVNVLVMLEVVYLFNTRYLRAPVLNLAGLFGSGPILIAVAVVIGLQLLFTYAPWMQALFDSRPVPSLSWGLIVLVAVATLLIVETEKWIGRRRQG